MQGCPRGAEPLASIAGTDGVLCLHGFTGSPWEVRPLADALTARGFSVAVPVLAGHATSLAALSETGWRDWLTSARSALDWLDARCERVHFVGLSMGALLAWLLAAGRPEGHGGAVVLLAPALEVPWAQRLAVELLSQVGWAEVAKSDPRLPGGVVPPCYSAVPLRAARELFELMDIMTACAQPLRTPCLVMHGTADATIPHGPALARARELLGSAARIRTVAGAGHLLPRDRRAHEVLDLAVEFFEQARTQAEAAMAAAVQARRAESLPDAQQPAARPTAAGLRSRGPERTRGRRRGR